MISLSLLYGSDQAQPTLLNPHRAPTVLVELLTIDDRGSLKRMNRFLAPRGTIVDVALIPRAESNQAYGVLEQVFEGDHTPKSSTLSWRGITNAAFADEQLFTTWTHNQALITWSDIDRTEAVLSVKFLNVLIPIDDPVEFARFVEEWIVENLQMPDPMPAKFRLFQTNGLNDDEVALTGFVGFPDEVSNRLATTVPPNKFWARTFKFVSTRTMLALIIPIHWITTESAQAPAYPVKDGKRASRFDRGD